MNEIVHWLADKRISIEALAEELIAVNVGTTR